MRAETDIQKLQRAIEEKRYRDAQELLETGDIEPEVAEKWLRWLADLYREEWHQAGFESEKQSAVQPQMTVLPLMAGMATVSVLLLMMMGLSVLVFNIPEMIIQASFSLVAIVSGAIGLHRAAVWLYPDHGREIGIVAWFGMSAYLVWSRVALWYTGEAQTISSVITFLLMLPLVIESSWYLGNKIGTEIAKRQVIDGK